MDMKNLFCLDLDQPGLEGFRRFISSWVYKGKEFTFLVDPGPLSTIPRLCDELERLGITRIDYVLLTHIHIDHAGGTGALLEQFPEAQVCCHPDGIRHMIAPEKLWQGSRKVLGALADAYGEIVPVPEDRIGYYETIGDTGIRAYLTPGHAQHHCSYLFDDLLIAGEVAGVRCDIPDGIFMRPATPPRFILKVALQSLDTMIALAPRRMIFAHHGIVDNGLQHLQTARRQLLLWVKGVAETMGVEESGREEALVRWLLDNDPCYRNVNRLPQDIQARERYFLGNTLRGMTEFVAELTEEERRELLT